MPKLTIGLPTYEDYNGVWFSLQALRMYHSKCMKDCEILVVDNNPGSECGEAVDTYLRDWVRDKGVTARYLPYTEEVGPAGTKNEVFRQAASDYVLCMDSHVLLWPKSLKRLIKYYKKHPHTRNLMSGPLVYDDLISISTHLDMVWRGQMLGIWSDDPRGAEIDNKPYEIPAMGMGCFTCRRDAWLGFHPLFRGFGGEEYYIHEKYKQEGKKCICLPFFRWNHRFNKPCNAAYPLITEDKVRNFIIGHLSLGLDLHHVWQHFVRDENYITQESWDRILRVSLSDIRNFTRGSE